MDVGPLGARIKRGIRVWPVNSGMAKEELYRWLRLDRPTDEDLSNIMDFVVLQVAKGGRITVVVFEYPSSATRFTSS